MAWSTSASSQEARQQAENKRILNGWDRALKQADLALTEFKPKKAYRMTSKVLREASNWIISGPQVEQLLGTALTLKSIAAHQLGKIDEATWLWHSAASIWPAAMELKLTAYGPTGPFLKENLPRTQEDFWSWERKAMGYRNEVQRPEKIKAPPPNFPEALRRKRGGVGVVVVSAIIDVDGVPKMPYVVNNTGPATLACATLDRLHEWRFKPAQKDGKPIPVQLNLTVTFQVQ